jgi:hypothetical protein
MQAEVMVRRFVVAAAAAWPVGSVALLAVAGWRTALAFALTFLLVVGDFWWMSWGLAKLLGSGEVPRGAQRWFLMGIAFRSLLLLLGIYGIFLILPKESLGVVLGIGCPLVLLTIAGAIPTRG